VQVKEVLMQPVQEEELDKEVKQFTMKKFFLSHLLLCVAASKIYAQLTYSPITIKQLDASVCWNVKLQVNYETNRVQLFGKISNDEGKLLIETESDKLILRQGLQNFDANNVRTTNIKFHDERVKRHLELYGRLPDGRYEFCTIAKAPNDGEEIGEDCISLTQTNTDTVSKPSKLKLPKELQFYGSASVEHIYSSRQGTDQIMPPHLVRVQAQPGVSIVNIPVSMNLYYTTERTALRPNQFAVSFQFDAQRFKENLRALVEKKMLEQLKINTAGLSKQYAQVAELGNINESLKGMSPNTSEIANLEGQIKSGDYNNIGESISAITQQATDALDKIDYNKLKSEYVDAKNQLSEYVPKDSVEEKQKKTLGDSLDARLQRLEAKKDSALSKLNSYNEKLKSVLEKKKKLEEMTGKLNQLKATAEQFQQLTEKKNQLEGLQKTLETATQGNYSEIGRLSDPTVLKENLMERGMFTGLNKLFFGVRQLQVGTVYPVYSPLVLNGIQVQGGAVEINPSIFFLNVTGGNTHIGARNFFDIFKSAYQRWMVGGKIGVGKVERSHFFVSYIHSFDKPNTLPAEVAPTVRPLQNDVLGAELQLTFWKGRIKLFAEGAGVSFNRNRNDSTLKVENSWYEKIPAFLKPNLSTSYDYAYTARGDFNFWKGSIISAYTEFIGPGYQSFGAPFLRNDVLRYGGRIEQALFKNRIKVSGKYRYEIDNLIESKRFTTTTHFYGAGFSFNQRKLPTLKIDYNGNLRKGTFNSQLMHSVTANSGYNYKIGKMNLRTGVNYQLIMSNADSISLSDYTVHNVTATQSVTFKFPVTVLANVGFNQMQNRLFTNRQIQVGAGITSMPFKNLNAGLNLDYVKNFNADYRLGTQVDLSYFFLKHLTLSVNCRYNHYQNSFLSTTNFNEVVLTTRLAVVW
jgi:hypothetical protein